MRMVIVNSCYNLFLIFIKLLWICVIVNGSSLKLSHHYSKSRKVNSKSSIENIQVQPNGLTVTSIQFNPTSQKSRWVDSVLGNKSLQFFTYEHFYPKYSHLMDFIFSEDKVSIEELWNVSQPLRKVLDADLISKHSPSCSFELLGSTKVDDEEPFMVPSKTSVVAGNATLSLHELNINIKCYYRALFENWKPEKFFITNYWSTFFYCPLFSSSVCQSIHQLKRNHRNYKIELSLHLQNTSWNNTFFSKLPIYPRKKILNRFVTSNFFPKNKVGVCIAIPYVSTDNAKALANGIMLQSWIRYYTNLDMHVFIYDRDAMNEEYVQRAISNDFTRQRVIYHNFTLRGLLDIETSKLKYDNNEDKEHEDQISTQTAVGRYVTQGIDKTQTLTHCRFEAKAVYGIDQVIVADYDEFLYCRNSEPSFESQKLAIHRIIEKHIDVGVDQLVFSQRVPSNKTISSRNCIVEKVQRNESLFDCYASYDFPVNMHSIKSIHLGHMCPLTGYHDACPSYYSPRTHDCMCRSQASDKCSFLHFSTNTKTFTNIATELIRSFNQSRLMKQPNEVYLMLNK